MWITFSFTNHAPNRHRVHFYDLKGTSRIQRAGGINDFATQCNDTIALTCGLRCINRKR